MTVLTGLTVLTVLTADCVDTVDTVGFQEPQGQSVNDVHCQSSQCCQQRQYCPSCDANRRPLRLTGQLALLRYYFGECSVGVGPGARRLAVEGCWTVLKGLTVLTVLTADTVDTVGFGKSPRQSVSDVRCQSSQCCQQRQYCPSCDAIAGC